jgi:hypothetical protein
MGIAHPHAPSVADLRIARRVTGLTAAIARRIRCAT